MLSAYEAAAKVKNAAAEAEKAATEKDSAEKNAAQKAAHAEQVAAEAKEAPAEAEKAAAEAEKAAALAEKATAKAEKAAADKADWANRLGQSSAAKELAEAEKAAAEKAAEAERAAAEVDKLAAAKAAQRAAAEKAAADKAAAEAAAAKYDQAKTIWDCGQYPTTQEQNECVQTVVGRLVQKLVPPDIQEELKKCDQMADKEAGKMCALSLSMKNIQRQQQQLKRDNPELFNCLANEPFEDPNCGLDYHEACGHIHNEWVARCQAIYGK